jgi:hypothetical protein
VASKIDADPNNCCFADAGHHRMAFTKCGILIDSSAGVPLQFRDSVPQKAGKVTYIMQGIEKGDPTLCYTVRLHSRIVEATLTRN